MPEPEVDASRVIAYLKFQIADLSGELAITKALLDATTEEHAKALRALGTGDAKPDLKVAGEDK